MYAFLGHEYSYNVIMGYLDIAGIEREGERGEGGLPFVHLQLSGNLLRQNAVQQPLGLLPLRHQLPSLVVHRLSNKVRRARLHFLAVAHHRAHAVHHDQADNDLEGNWAISGVLVNIF